MTDLTVNLLIDLSNLEKSFDRIAKDLFNNYVLNIQDEVYQLAEIEFYCNNYKKTLDNFAHQHDDNIKNGTWRLHGAGLDIVLKEKGLYYGGILIRGIQKIDTNQNPIEVAIDGPWNVATTCVAGQLVECNNNRFYLTKSAIESSRAFKKSPRVGLFFKKVEDLEYICKPWRYSTTPIGTQKGKQLLFLQLFHEQDSLQSEIIKNKSTQDSYKRYFEAGKKMAVEEFIEKKMTSERICQLFGCYIQHYNKL